MINLNQGNSLRSWVLALLALALLVSSSTTMMGCSSEGTSDSASTDDEDGDGENPPVGDIDEANFWVRFYDSGAHPFHVHASTGFNDDCEIAAAATDQTVDCVAEINEGDLFFHQAKLHYNVPTNMCTYLERTPYYFYNQEIGYGPNSFVMNVTFDVDGNLTAATCSVDGSATTDCSIDNNDIDFREVNFDPKTVSASCLYNKEQAGGANCCFGDYQATLNVTRNAVVTTSYIDGKWGGSWKSCIGGPPATSAWTIKSKNGWPASLISYVFGEGLNSTLNLAKLIEEPNGWDSITIANHYNSPSATHHYHTSVTGVGGGTSVKPFAVDPIDDRSGTPLTATSDSYDFKCLDKAFEVRNRIRFYIREWDAYADYLAYISSAGVTSDPDRFGEDEGSDCDGIFGECNDIWDLDDLPSYLGTLGIGAVNDRYDQSGGVDNADINNRGVFFPEIDY